MSISIQLSSLRWRPKQRRLVTDKHEYANYDEIIVNGQQNIIKFRVVGYEADPHTKLKKIARVYKPVMSSTPLQFQDIILYIHTK